MISEICELYEADASEMCDVLAGRNVRLVIGSPPYVGKGERYPGGGKPWVAEDWVPWMVDVIQRSLVVAPVVAFVVNDCYRGGRYIPAVAMLEAACYAAGIVAERPLVWSKNAPPNRKDWWGNGTERIVAFKRCAAGVPTWNWESIATPPKFTNGGAFSQRDSKGARRKGGEYPKSKLARPHDLLRATVGGGHLGHPLAHKNEAPYPEKLVIPIIAALTDPADIVFDPFNGSGTTCAAALKLGRSAIGFDNRASQIELAARRIVDETRIMPTITTKANHAQNPSFHVPT